MHPAITHLSDAPVSETPNAVMRTCASPSVGGSELAVWRTEMAPGASGPLHVADIEQVVVVLAGRLRTLVGGTEHVLEAGDAAVVPATVERQLSNPHAEPVTTLTAARPGSLATVGQGAPVGIPWAR